MIFRVLSRSPHPILFYCVCVFFLIPFFLYPITKFPLSVLLLYAFPQIQHSSADGKLFVDVVFPRQQCPFLSFSLSHFFRRHRRNFFLSKPIWAKCELVFHFSRDNSRGVRSFRFELFLSSKNDKFSIGKYEEGAESAFFFFYSCRMRFLHFRYNLLNTWEIWREINLCSRSITIFLKYSHLSMWIFIRE